MTCELVALDVGGTHARFAIAAIADDGSIALEAPVILRTADFPGLHDAWTAFARRGVRTLPRSAAIAIAAPVSGPIVRMTNGHWQFDQRQLADELAVERLTVINDFGAVAHAVAQLGDRMLEPLCGPRGPLPLSGSVSVLGPGTGLGVAHFHRFAGGYHVQATEGAHIAFGASDTVEDALVARLRPRFGRVSVERVVSGPGLAEIRAVLGASGVESASDALLWQSGIDGTDPLSVQAVDRFCQILGSVAGDYALAHGASAVVLAGGLAVRLAERLRMPSFARRFCAKGRYESMLAQTPVRLLVHPQPGLHGVAAAFAQEHLTPTGSAR